MENKYLLKTDEEHRTLVFKRIKEKGLADEYISWLKNNKNINMTLLHKLASTSNQCIRFSYWFDVIKDAETSTDIEMILYISGIDCQISSKFKITEYKCGKFCNALHRLHESGNMNGTTLNQLYDLCRLVYNIEHDILKYYKIYSFKWLNYFMNIDFIHDNHKSFKPVILCNMHNRSDYSEVVNRNKLESDKILSDSNFINEYIKYIECDSETIKYIGYITDSLNIFIKEIDKCNQNTVNQSKERIEKYINAKSGMHPTKFWEMEFGPKYNYDNDKYVVSNHFPDLHQSLITYVKTITNNIFSVRIHTLENMYDKLSEKFDNLFNITLFEYLSNGGIADINGTLNFIINSNIYNPNVRKLIGPLKKLSKHTLNYVNYEDEMNNLHIIKEHELTSDEKQKIFDYMDNNNYPHWLVLFNQIAKSYIENDIEL